MFARPWKAALICKPSSVDVESGIAIEISWRKAALFKALGGDDGEMSDCRDESRTGDMMRRQAAIASLV
jgi:hypothetical protein